VATLVRTLAARGASPGLKRLVSPSVVVTEKVPASTTTNCVAGGRMVQAVLQIVSAPLGVRSNEESGRDWAVAARIQRRCRWSGVRL
jgi:hypothetical protein